MKYKEGVKEIHSSLYHQLPETTETQMAKHLSELQSDVGTQTFIENRKFYILFWENTQKAWRTIQKNMMNFSTEILK